MRRPLLAKKTHRLYHSTVGLGLGLGLGLGCFTYAKIRVVPRAAYFLPEPNAGRNWGNLQKWLKASGADPQLLRDLDNRPHDPEWDEL